METYFETENSHAIIARNHTLVNFIASLNSDDFMTIAIVAIGIFGLLVM